MKRSFTPRTSIENTAIEIFGLTQADVQSLSAERNGTMTKLDVTLTPDYPKCPHCGCDHPKIYSYITKVITHSVLQEQNCILVYNARRYKCSWCHKTYYEKNPFVFKQQRISKKTVMDVLEALKDASATFSGVARRFNLSPTTVQAIFDEHVSVPRATKLPRVLQLDETYSFKSKDSRYVCMLLDYDA